MIGTFASILRDDRGAAVIETAIVAPALLMLSLGSFDVSRIVARQHELQTGADDAASMALAGWTSSTGTTEAIKTVLKRTLSLTDDQVKIDPKFRCGTAANIVDSAALCAATDIVTTYLKIKLTDTYTPVWTGFGVGKPISYSVTRTVVVS